MPGPALSIDAHQPLVLKANELALLVEPDGDIRGETRPGYGLFWRDARYLRGYRLRIGMQAPLVLMCSDERGDSAELALANPEIGTSEGGPIAAHAVQMSRTLKLAPDERALVDTLELRSFADHPLAFPLSLELSAAFEDALALRGSKTPRGALDPPDWDGERLAFAYQGVDEIRRTLTVRFSLPPTLVAAALEPTAARFRPSLAPGAVLRLVTTLAIAEEATGAAGRRAGASSRRNARRPDGELGWQGATIAAGDSALDRTLRRSLADLGLLQVDVAGERFTAAGVPWYLARFGRDSLIPAIQCIALAPGLARDNARSLAARQGRRYDPRSGEEPGRILHEHRVGESAHSGGLRTSFRNVDATALFLIAIARHAERCGDLALVRELRPNVEAALGWIDRREDGSRRGFIEYGEVDDEGRPVNQGWRDSAEGVLRADGGYPSPPVALASVQAYVFRARLDLAATLRRLGEENRADRLEAQAAALRDRFERAFWLEREGLYALALEGDGARVGSITSDGAQLLWTGVATPDRAARAIERVMQPDMFTGWGVRSLSADHPKFDPLAYQQGGVWPFTAAFLLSGFRRYGADDAAARLFEALAAAATLGFRDGRLPEFFSGDARRPHAPPIRAPRAEPIQAWSASALPFMLTEMLGLQVEGFERRVRLRRPQLPRGLDCVRFERLRVADSAVTLSVERRDGALAARLAGAAGVGLVVED